MADFQVVKF